MKQYNYIYVLGIGGYAMSALARWFNHQGAQVFGYDRAATGITDQLIQEDIEIHFNAEIAAIPQAIIDNKSNSLIIYSSAIPNDQPILAYLTANNYSVFKRTAVFDSLTKQHATWAVAGTHGKTTTSSMAAHVLYQAGENIAAFLGGIAKNYGSNLVIQEVANKDKMIVIEADEYDHFFLSLHPDIAIVTTVDPDHLDTYQDEAGFKQGFRDFLDRLPQKGLAIIHDQVARELSPNPKHKPQIVTYALEKAPIRAANIHIHQGIFHFDYISEGLVIKDIQLAIPGYHNIENALAVITACLFVGIDPDVIRQAIATFQGAVRRFDRIIERDDLVFLDDYGHHPVEITALIKATRQVYPGKKIAIIFRPNLYTRTRDFALEFARSLDLADCVFLLDIYPDREQPIPGITSETIFNQLSVDKKYLCTKDTLLDCLADYGKPEVILNVGSGGTSQFIAPIKKFLLDVWG
jgi:UDP-N-acetylmuramate--alanine ligase